MVSKTHFFLGLDAATIRRMSFLMLASSLRVGTAFNSFFLPFSISLARYLELESRMFTLCCGVVPLSIASNPSGFFAKWLPARRAMIGHTSSFIAAIKQYFQTAFPAPDSQNFHLGNVKDSFLFAHEVLL